MASCLKVDDHVLTCTCDYFVPTMMSELLYPLQNSHTPLHLAAKGGHATCVKHLLSTPGIDVNIMDKVSWSIEHVHVYEVVNSII